jgi:putative peptidoglycan lipid II flippase
LKKDSLPTSSNGPEPLRAARGGATFVAAGIFLSRIAGLIRERVFAHYFGNSNAADAFKAALKIPNFLQNLFGEGVLSASFIPVYARLLAEGNDVEADRVAGVIATLLAVTTSLLAVLGVWLTPYMIDLIAPGFEGAKRELTAHLVQILFPGVALLVMSAWCLGVLNSHRRFFLSYVAPVVWNFAIIGTLLYFGTADTLPLAQENLAQKAAWGLVLGSFLQFAVQLPTVLKLARKLRFTIEWKSKNVRTILTSFSSVVVARGVVQISAYIDNVLASWLPTGAVSALAYAQTIYLLPVSLFGMSVSAASLAEMSRSRADGEESKEKLRLHLDRGLKQIAFFIVPSTAAFVLLGDVGVAALYQTGRFSDQDVKYVWFTLAGSGFGLLASTLGRLYASTFYALQDTKTPLRYAVVRVVLTTILGYIAGIWLPPWFGISSSWGTVGLTVTAGLSGWVEFFLLRRNLNRRIGQTGVELSFLTKLWLAALLSSAGGWVVKLAMEPSTLQHTIHPVLRAVGVFGVFGLIYFAMTFVAGVPQAENLWRSVRRRF